MAAVPGATTCWLNGCGVRSNTKRSTCTPMTAWPRRAVRLVATWPSTTASGHTRALTHARRTKPTSKAVRWRRPRDVRRRCGASLRSGYALPTRRPATAIDRDNRQGNHLSEPKRCSDKPGHLRLISEMDARNRASALVMQDAKETEESHGQNVRDAFPLGDVFIDATSRPQCEAGLRRFMHLLFGSNEITPTRDEYGMYIAKSASLRSSDLSRQVGAAIFRPTGEVLSLGCNEVPKFGGGYY